MLAAGGSQLAVVNLDAKVAQQDPANPYGVIAYTLFTQAVPAGATVAITDAQAANVHPLSILPGVRYLDLYHYYGGTADPTTSLKVRVYGDLPEDAANDVGETSLTPFDTTPASFDRYLPTIMPLVDPLTGESELEFVLAAAMVSDDNTLKVRMSRPRRVGIAGEKTVYVLVSQAANQAGVGLVVARQVH